MSVHRLRGMPLLFVYFVCAFLCAASAYFLLPWIQDALLRELALELARGGGGFGGNFDAFVFAALFLVLFLGLCVALQAVFFTMRGKGTAHGQQAGPRQSQPQAGQRELLDALPVGMGILIAGQCRFANPALRAMTGMQPG